MSRPESDERRPRRAERLRTDWRKGEDTARASEAPIDSDENRRRQDDALASNDRIRNEEPDHLENRRRADQLEREIKRARREDQ